MITGSLCLTEILKSWKSCSSNSDASQTADSTSASGVALPYLASSRGSSDPALTPIRIETPASLAVRAISLIWSSNLRMLPGLTRTAAQPASIAAKTYFGWKWMSAITGICDLRAIADRASASSWVGTATRTMSQPAAVSAAICWSVALMSVVGVVHIDWTLTGAPPPTSILPTLILRVGRREASTGAGASGMPRLIGMLTRPLSPLSLRATPRGVCLARHRHISPAASLRERAAEAGSAEGDRGDDVGVDQQHPEAREQHEHPVGERDEPCGVEGSRPRQAAHARDLTTGSLPQGPQHVPAVEREQRDEVEHEQRDVERGDEAEQARDPLTEPVAVGLVGRDLPREAPDPDGADDTGPVARFGPDRGLGDVHDARRQRGDDLHRLPHRVAGDDRHLGDRLPLEDGAGRDSQKADGLRDGAAVRRDLRRAVRGIHRAIGDDGRNRRRDLPAVTLEHHLDVARARRTDQLG